ncbi:hypothetical protein ACH4OX_28610 [Streptomyces roseolus]|uniref:hypothetical protein n=1 Tax=Streptomyces roseolus TaxID=67358 RepID=UPI0037BDE641
MIRATRASKAASRPNCRWWLSPWAITTRPSQVAGAVGAPHDHPFLFLFGSEEGPVLALLARARTDEELVWGRLAAREHRPLPRPRAEVYARSLVEPGGTRADFARATAEDRLTALRGALLDLLATDDTQRFEATVAHQLALFHRI